MGSNVGLGGEYKGGYRGEGENICEDIEEGGRIYVRI